MGYLWEYPKIKCPENCVKMLDHIIIGGETGDMYSFKSDGLLDQLRPARAIWER